MPRDTVEQGVVPQRVWWAAFAAFTLVTAGGWGVVAWRERGDALAAAERQLRATARLLEQHADRAIDAGDVFLT